MLDKLLSPEMDVTRLILWYIMLLIILFSVMFTWRRNFKRTANYRLVDLTWTKQEYLKARENNKKVVIGTTIVCLVIIAAMYPIFAANNPLTMGLEAWKSLLDSFFS